MYEVDLRSFQGANGLAYRMCFDLTALTPAEGRGFLVEVVERLGAGGDGCEPIVDVAEEGNA